MSPLRRFRKGSFDVQGFGLLSSPGHGKAAMRSRRKAVRRFSRDASTVAAANAATFVMRGGLRF